MLAPLNNQQLKGENHANDLEVIFLLYGTFSNLSSEKENVKK